MLKQKQKRTNETHVFNPNFSLIFYGI